MWKAEFLLAQIEYKSSTIPEENSLVLIQDLKPKIKNKYLILFKKSLYQSLKPLFKASDNDHEHERAGNLPDAYTRLNFRKFLINSKKIPLTFKGIVRKNDQSYYRISGKYENKKYEYALHQATFQRFFKFIATT